MSDTVSTFAADDVLDRFVQDYHEAADKEAVLREYAAAHPQLAGEFRELAAMQQLLATPAPAVPDPYPKRLPDLRILRLIGVGGMGVVFEAWQESLKRRVAVKIRHGQLAPAQHERFRREQLVLAKLHQTHIVPIHLSGQEERWQYFAMAFIDGAALHHVVRTTWQHETVKAGRRTPTLAEVAGELVKSAADSAKTALPQAAPTGEPAPTQQPSDNLLLEPAGAPLAVPPAATSPLQLTLSLDYFRSVAQVMADAAEALDHAHRADILHRDVKPSNIMVDTKGHCWLIDFGLARVAHRRNGTAEPPEKLDSNPDLELTQGPMGTPEYMAPEQYQKPDAVDARADVWGLGVTLYELLTLRRAFTGQTGDEIKTKIVSAEPAPLKELVSNVPPDLAAICLKAIQKQPEPRYSTAGEFAEDLRRWLRLEPTRARPAWPLRRAWLWARRNKGWAAAIFFALLSFTLLAGAGILLEKTRADAAAHERDAEAKERKNETKRREQEAAERLRGSLMHQLQSLLQGTHNHGWSEDGRELVRKITKIRGGEDLKNQAVRLLAGTDAHERKHFDFNASSVAFDPRGTRLLMGGYTDPRGKPVEPARVWGGGIDEPRKSTQLGSGPVAFRADDGAALQLAVKPGTWFTLLLWNVDKQEAVREFKVPAEVPANGQRPPPRLSLALSADGSRVAASTTASDGKTGTLLVWDVQTGKEVFKADKKLIGLAFSPDSSLLAGSEKEGAITVWSLKQAKPIATLSSSRAAIHALTFARDTRRRDEKPLAEDDWLLAAGDASGTVTVWDLHARQVKSFCRGSQHNVYAVAFSPDGTVLASAGRDSAKLWDVATGGLLLNLKFRNLMTGLAFSPDGRRLAVSSVFNFNAGGVDVYELEYGRGVQMLRGLTNRVAQIAISPDDRFLAALSDGWQVAVWDLAAGRLRHIIDAPVGYFTDNAGLAFSHDGGLFAFSSGQEAKLWDVKTGEAKPSWILPPGLGDRLAFDRAGKRLLLVRMESEGREQPPRVCRARDLLGENPLKEFAEIKEFKRQASVWAVAPDASYFVVDGTPDGDGPPQRIVRAFDGATGKEKQLDLPLAADQRPYVTLDPTGKVLALSHDTRNGRSTNLLEMPSGKLLGTLKHGTAFLGPQAEYVIGVAPSYPWGSQALFRRQDEMPLVVLNTDRPGATGALFDTSGKRVAWGNTDGTVIVCDLKEVQERLAAVGLGW